MYSAFGLKPKWESEDLQLNLTCKISQLIFAHSYTDVYIIYAKLKNRWHKVPDLYDLSCAFVNFRRMLQRQFLLPELKKPSV